MAQDGPEAEMALRRRLAAALFTSSVLCTSAAFAGNACEAEIESAAGRYGVPPAILYAVGLTETGRARLASALRPQHRGAHALPEVGRRGTPRGGSGRDRQAQS